MIDFELEPQVAKRLEMYHAVAENMMRPISREYDEREHEDPVKYFETMWQAQALTADVGPAARSDSDKKSGPSLRNLNTVISTEELSW